ncbi:hypothetical protein PHISP_02461 [Aspergillus sp. HF37]|nr:hypothetical protein PHISP_02461 [Aspergillus sp. HF37]
MSTERPQFYQNNLKPVDITPDSLRRVLQELCTAARHGADLVHHGSPPTDDWGNKGMFSGAPATSGSDGAVSGDDVRCLFDAVRMALAIPPVVSHGGRNMGVDELMLGRAGLLWGLLNMRTHRFNEKAANALSPVFEAVPRLIGVMIDAGRKGSTSYSRQHGTKDSLPLMWTWMEGYSGLGAVHGMTSARQNSDFFSNYWRPEWDQATRLATERVWEEGLLSKGGSICHGIAGNAWPLLLLHDCFEYGDEQTETAKRNFTERSQTHASSEAQLTGDYFLSRALAFLLHARETRPYNTTNRATARYYRMPDSPYCLFEGLAGTICAWTDACAAIEARLRKMELDEGGNGCAAALEQDDVFQELVHRQLGFPALGGHGVTGVF